MNNDGLAAGVGLCEPEQRTLQRSPQIPRCLLAQEEPSSLCVTDSQRLLQLLPPLLHLRESQSRSVNILGAAAPQHPRDPAGKGGDSN